MAMITSPKVRAIPTCPSARSVFSSTMIAPAPAKTSANVPIASARSACASAGVVAALGGRRAVVGFVRGVERALELVDEVARDLERLLLDRVVDPGALATRADEAGAPKRPQVLRDPRLAVRELVLQMAHAERPSGSDLREQLEADGVGERLEHLEGQVARLGNDSRRRQLTHHGGKRPCDLTRGLFGHRSLSLAAYRERDVTKLKITQTAY